MLYICVCKRIRLYMFILYIHFGRALQRNSTSSEVLVAKRKSSKLWIVLKIRKPKPQKILFKQKEKHTYQRLQAPLAN